MSEYEVGVTAVTAVHLEADSKSDARRKAERVVGNGRWKVTNVRVEAVKHEIGNWEEVE